MCWTNCLYRVFVFSSAGAIDCSTWICDFIQNIICKTMLLWSLNFISQPWISSNLFFLSSHSLGRHHVVNIVVCNCERNNVTFMRHRLWASSVENPSVAFHMDLLNWMEFLVLEAKVPLRTICQSLRWTNDLSISQVIMHAINITKIINIIKRADSLIFTVKTTTKVTRTSCPC